MENKTKTDNTDTRATESAESFTNEQARDRVLFLLRADLANLDSAFEAERSRLLSAIEQIESWDANKREETKRKAKSEAGGAE